MTIRLRSIDDLTKLRLRERPEARLEDPCASPGNIQDLFQDISDIRSYNTRSSASNNFYTQSSRLSIQVNSFSRIGTKIWNEMPVSLRKLSKNAFKGK